MILFGHLVGKVVCEKLNYVAPRKKKHGKHEMECNMKKARKSCRLLISFCKMKLFVRKKKHTLYFGFEIYIYCYLALVTISRKLSNLPDSVRFACTASSQFNLFMHIGQRQVNILLV